MIPKRVSIWTLDGRLVRAMYGPNWYGGGGAIDPVDKTRFYLHGNGGGMEFRLDWGQGASRLVNLHYLPGMTGTALPGGWAPYPQTPIYVGGRLYLTNCYASGPTSGEDVASIWLWRDGVAVPVAALGSANSWDLLKQDSFRSRWPQGIDLKGDVWHNGATFAWSDLNGDGLVQPEEVTMVKGNQVAFRSWWTVHLDQVLDVTDSVRLAAQGGNYELSVPLSVLGFQPVRGMVVRGDIGILRGNGVQTVERVYWNNKASGVVSDVPSEAQLTPQLWGRWRFLEQ